MQLPLFFLVPVSEGWWLQDEDSLVCCDVISWDGRVIGVMLVPYEVCNAAKG